MAMDSLSNIYENRTRYAKYFDSSSNDQVSIQTFYKLLIAEMANQDPLEPMSNTEFVSQMASFTSLQVQQDALYYSNANYAQSMVGKTVIVAADTGKGFKVESGKVTKVDFSGGQFEMTVNGQPYSLKNVMEIVDESYGVAAGNDGAYATSLIGKYVTVGLVKDDGAAVVETGTVERVEIKDGEISIIIGGVAYPLYSVAKIENAAPKPAVTAEGGETEVIPEPAEGGETGVIPEPAEDGETGVIPEPAEDGETDIIVTDSEELEDLFG
ncbi:MAG: flagellar hook capping protein [Oscillospiraceae bacterium]|jgi:flagellar hook assembly protein FlgD|nr:flagellar hook capping protein [Oscillospiraceae bacterium]